MPAAATAEVLARLPLRDDLRGRTPYGAPQLDVPVRLNTNENSYDVPAEVVEAIVAAIRAEAGQLNRYPDREFTALRAGLAGYLGHGLGPEQIWAGNGSNEVIQHALQAFGGPGRLALGFTPSYSMHPIISSGTGTEWVDGVRGADEEPFGLDPARTAAQVARHRPDVVFLCSPNNPTGTALSLDVITEVYAATGGIVVVDEAYAEFARPGTPSGLSLLPERERLVITRTMSKAFSLAGARLGYLAADPAVCDAFRLVRLPYHLSSLTQAAARAALAHAPALLSTVEAVKAQRDRIVAALPALGLHPVPSDANFVLFGGLADERATWRDLLARGVLIRDVDLPHHLRVTAGTPAETTAFLDALAAVLEETAMSRAARVERTTKESSVVVELDLDGTGRSEISTGIGFYDHMLATLAKHAAFDLAVSATGDLGVDAHHTVEDVAIVLGRTLQRALGDKSGIRRFGDALVPLDECLVQAAVDVSGRPYCAHGGEPEGQEYVVIGGVYPGSLTRHVFQTLAHSAGIALHVRVLSGRDPHHVVEAQFKAVARALRAAVEPDPRAEGVPSTKGSL